MREPHAIDPDQVDVRGQRRAEHQVMEMKSKPVIGHIVITNKKKADALVIIFHVWMTVQVGPALLMVALRFFFKNSTSIPFT